MSLRDKVKKAWFQGQKDKTVEGPITSNDPEVLGYPKEIAYPHKPMEVPVGGDSRDWEQKWFEGAAAETKKVMGPQGAEFKLKQEMQRIPMDEKIANAKLKVTFTRTAKPQSSYWTVVAVDKTTGKEEKILKATLDQIWGEELNQENANISATKEYGEEIIARLRNRGFGKVAYLMTGDKSFVKKAQQMYDAVAPEAPAEAPAELGAAIEGAAGEDASRADATVEELVAKKNEVEMAETKLIELLPENAATAGRELQAVEEELEAAIHEEKEIAARLRDKTISASAKVAIMKIAQEAFDAAADEVLPGADAVLENTQSLIDKANTVIEKVDQVVQEEGGAPAAEGAAPAAEVAVMAPEAAPAEAMEMSTAPAMAKTELTVAEIKNFLSKRAELQKAAAAEEQKYGVIPDGAPKDGDGEINAAHPKGGEEIGDLTVGLPVKDKGDRVETEIERQKHDILVTNKMPTGELNNSVAVAASKAKFEKLAELIKNAEVDSATKEFWTKSLWGQSDADAKAFGQDLVKDYENKVSAAVSETEGRVKRAFELAEVAATKGFCEPTTASKLALFNKISKMDDNGFMAFKEAVELSQTKRAYATEAPASLTKTASKLPIIGQKENTANVNAAELSPSANDDFSSLDRLGWN